MAQLSVQQKEQAIQKCLTVDNKGWNRSLFIGSNDELSGLQCQTCLNICRDPSVIDCTEHKDNGIAEDVHCYQCLIHSIQQNNNKRHNNPIVRRIKPIFNMVRKQIVLCPFSTRFKNICSEQNEVAQQIHDTRHDDQKEGAPGANLNEAGKCRWKGSLNQLITEHFPHCIRVCKPTFLLEIENKALRLQNQSLVEEIQLLKQAMPTMHQQYEENTKRLEMIITNLKRGRGTKDTDNNSNIVMTCGVKEHHVYSLHWPRIDDKRFLARDRESKWLHQRNTEMYGILSLFAFVPCFGDNERYWVIRIAHDNKWLSYGSCSGRTGNSVCFAGNDSAQWKLISTSQNTPMCYILQCFYGGKSRGYLGYQKDGKWNKLHMERGKACIYRLSLAKYEDHFIQEGGIYAMQCNGEYISYKTWEVDAGDCKRSPKYKLQDSSFRFSKGPMQNTWFIQNVYKDSRHNYWLTYALKTWSLYQDVSDRSLWHLLPCPQRMEFKIECIFDGKVIGWGYAPMEAIHLKPYKYSQFKLQQK
eukprot:245399_1